MSYRSYSSSLDHDLPSVPLPAPAPLVAAKNSATPSAAVERPASCLRYSRTRAFTEVPSSRALMRAILRMSSSTVSVRFVIGSLPSTRNQCNTYSVVGCAEPEARPVAGEAGDGKRALFPDGVHRVHHVGELTGTPQ